MYESYRWIGLSNCIALTRSTMAARSPASPGGGSPSSFTTALPAPETPSLCFTIAERTAGRAARSRRTASMTSSAVRRSSAPRGYETPALPNSFRQPLFVPRSKCRGSAPYMGMPSRIARSRSSSVVL